MILGFIYISGKHISLMTENYETAQKIRELAMEHNDFFRKSIPLIASENIMSPLAMEMLLTDFGFRYAEGLPHHRYYQGNFYVDQVEDITIDLAKKLFRSDQADPRPVSGTNANTSVIYGLLKPGDKISTPPLSGGGHISAAKFGAVGLRGLDIVNYPFDVENMNLDVDGTIKLIKNERPKVCLFGQSVFLFPTPLKDLKDAAAEVGAKIWYDGAHVLGLIAGGKFQDPLREGAEIITGSTHKTLPGPQHGIILGKTDESAWKSVQRGVFPGTISNHHINAMAALGVTLAEELDYGTEYAGKIIENAKYLASCLAEDGFKVLGEKNGYTESHTLVVDVRDNGGGKYVAELLEKSGIVLNKNLLPWDDGNRSQDPSGLRIGTQEVTRIGFGKSEMKEISRLVKMAVIDKKSPEMVKKEAADLKSRFRKVKYCYGDLEAYKYIKLLN
jgi:glycine hydroxymethyltransferase